MTSDAGPVDPDRSKRFRTTRWTLIVAAGDSQSAAARDAVNSLCQQYWYPVYAFFRRSGAGQDAEDRTQAFFTFALASNLFAKAHRDRGKFRSFLLTAARNFLSHGREADAAQKRGGGAAVISIDAVMADQKYGLEPADTLTPDQLYEHAWARTLLTDATARLESARAGDATALARFTRLKPLLLDDGTADYASLAAELGLTDGALRVAVHRLRREFGACVRAAVSDTVGDPAQVDEELRYLAATLRRAPHS